MMLLLLLCVKDYKVLLIFIFLIKYIVGYGNVLGGVVIDIGLFNWKVFGGIKLVY